MDNKIVTKKENSTDNLEKRKEVYSIRITTRQKDLIRNNKDIKEDLDKYVISYLKSFF
ncbi:hypothetical protein ACTNDG_01785 [Clostridium sp. HCP1S3_B4]|uniref:hypothetical protein n=1 Tax=unclassified Clostridium TaxID=2614128 RepID=UPI0016BBCE20|nr:hypothetical protein [Clostridiales bacterium]MDY2729295.1 hypothetical protein [Clostridium sp.]NLK24634.1 hypothetical protein [Clostridiales bacterium]